MRYPKPVKSSIRPVLIVLAFLSALFLVLPSSWTHRLISLVQFLVPLQHGTVAALDAVPGTASDDGATVAAEDLEALQLAKDASDHERASLAVRVSELEREVQALSKSRNWQAEGRRIGDRGRLIPARVITGDLLAWRSSQLINSGSLQGVRRGSAVISNHFTVDRGAEDEVRTGMAILLGEALIGIVEQCGTHTSRVQLLSDVAVEMKVRIARIEAEAVKPVPGYFWLRGIGGGRTQIRDVSRRDVEAGLIGVGDLVLSDPDSRALPAALVIGKVVEMTPDRREPLFSILTVENAVKPDVLERIYVFDSSAPD
jgi:cell shape-determining protein MreC